MTTSMVPVGKPRLVAGVEVQYIGDKSHSHEGGHSFALDGRKVEVAPDGHTQARNRSHVITRVLHETEGMPEATRLQAVVGALALDGATNILVDGKPLRSGGKTLASFKLEVDDQGAVYVTSLGGTT